MKVKWNGSPKAHQDGECFVDVTGELCFNCETWINEVESIASDSIAAILGEVI